MGHQRSRRIVRERLSEPHIKGRRVSVLQLREEVEAEGLAPATVADRYDLEVADVYRALAYYHEHPEEMAAVRKDRAEAAADIRDRARDHRPEGVTPPGDGE